MILNHNVRIRAFRVMSKNLENLHAHPLLPPPHFIYLCQEENSKLATHFVGSVRLHQLYPLYAFPFSDPRYPAKMSTTREISRSILALRNMPQLHHVVLFSPS